MTNSMKLILAAGALALAACDSNDDDPAPIEPPVEPRGDAARPT